MSMIRTVFGPPDSEAPDVLITTPYQQFTLHSKVLKLCSRWFTASMSKVWWTGVNMDGDVISYRYVLNFDKDGVSTLLPDHQPFPPGKIPEAEKVKELCDRFHVLFKCFYNEPITIHSLDNCLRLVTLADQYDALESIAESVRVSFFELPEHDIDVEIQKDPTTFLMLGYRLQSAQVFKEAFIHIVGLHVGRPTMVAIWSVENDIPRRIIELVWGESYKLSRVVSAAIKRYLMLGAGMVHSEDKGYGRVALAVVKDRLGEYCSKFGDAGHEGLLFRAIVQDPFSVAGTDFAPYGWLHDLPESQLIQERILPGVKRAASYLARNNLRLKEEMKYLTCAELSGDHLPEWLKS